MAPQYAIFFMLFFLTSLYNLPHVLSDTPSNCTYEDIAGKWAFHVGKSGFTNTIKCNRTLNVSSVVIVELLFPDVAVDSDGNKGFWTMIYNQGFEVVINDRKYFAFSAYKTNGSVVTSMCDRTFNGWVHDAMDSKKNWACYFGIKVSQSHIPGKTHKVDQISKQYRNRKYKINKEFIDQINKAQTSWTAGIYEEYESYSLGELSLRSGSPAQALQIPKPWKPTPEMLLAASAIPEEFDWRNVSGTNYVSPIRNQASCGSCYAFATMGMFEARVRIMTHNQQKPILSTQDIVSCSEYSQGCEGGFPYLISKYGEDFGFVDEGCFPYEAKDDKCLEKKCTRLGAVGYQYVGGFYGACNEILMQMELVKGGPIAIGMMVYSDFMQYKGGIYHHTGLKDGFNPFDLTNHAVLVVGYGVDKQTSEKYWIVKNSWGTNWGEDGYFRIRRGTNEVAVESMAVAAYPVLA